MLWLSVCEEFKPQKNINYAALVSYHVCTMEIVINLTQQPYGEKKKKKLQQEWKWFCRYALQSHTNATDDF